MLHSDNRHDSSYILVFALLMIGTGAGYAYMGSGDFEKILRVERIPGELDFVLYSSLMGMLATGGASLQLGKNWHFNYRTVYLRLSNSDFSFLSWLTSFFQCSYFDFSSKSPYKVVGSQTNQIGTIPTNMCYILWWYEEGVHLLPFHFAQYFSIHTLAFWAMRNGQWNGNTFLIHVGRLNEVEKQLLMSLIKDKLGYESKLTMKNTKLAISNPAKLVEELKPLFHESQLYRLVKKIK